MYDITKSQGKKKYRKEGKNMGRREMEKLHTKILKYLVPHHHHVHQISIRKIRMVLGTHLVYIQMKNNFPALMAH